MKKLFILLTTFILCFGLLVSCDSRNSQENSHLDNSHNNSEEIEDGVFKRYLDHTEIKDGDLDLKLDLYENNWNNKYSLHITLKLTSHNTKKVKFYYRNVKLLRISNGVSYDVDSYNYNMNEYVELQCDIEDSISYSADIPTSIKDEKYQFIINTNSTYIYELYETPLELRESFDVEYNLLIDGKVNTVSYKDGTLLQKYVWLSNDGYEFCDKWYLDERYKEPVPNNFKITKDIKLYGLSDYCCDFSYLTSDDYAYLGGFNYIPKDGIIKVPAKYHNREVCISNFAIYNTKELVEIYLPNTIHHIYGSNFESVPNLRTVYFAGTKAEWDAIPTSSPLPLNIRLVCNTKY